MPEILDPPPCTNLDEIIPPVLEFIFRMGETERETSHFHQGFILSAQKLVIVLWIRMGEE